MLINKLKKLFPTKFDENKKVLVIPGINYSKLLRLLKKLRLAVRSYRLDRIVQARVISPNDIEDAISFINNTYYRGSYNKIVNKYRSTK